MDAVTQRQQFFKNFDLSRVTVLSICQKNRHI